MRPPGGRGIGQRQALRLAGESARGRLSEAGVADVGVPSSLTVACQCLELATALQALRYTAPERHVGRHSPGRRGEIEPSSAEAACTGALLRRRPRPHIVPGAASVVADPSFYAS